MTNDEVILDLCANCGAVLKHREPGPARPGETMVPMCIPCHTKYKAMPPHKQSALFGLLAERHKGTPPVTLTAVISSVLNALFVDTQLSLDYNLPGVSARIERTRIDGKPFWSITDTDKHTVLFEGGDADAAREWFVEWFTSLPSEVAAEHVMSPLFAQMCAGELNHMRREYFLHTSGKTTDQILDEVHIAREQMIELARHDSTILTDAMSAAMQTDDDSYSRAIIPVDPPILVEREPHVGGGGATWRFTDAATNQVQFESTKMAEVHEHFSSILDALPRKERTRVLADLHRQVKKIERDVGRLKVRVQDHTEQTSEEEKDALSDEIEAWFKGGLRLQKVQATGFHRFRTAFKKAEVYSLIARLHLEDIADATALAQPFLVEHDWAAALATARDMDEGEINMPYDAVAFEFRISGKHVIALMSNDRMAPFIELSTGTWCLPRTTFERRGFWNWEMLGEPMPEVDAYVKPLSDMILAQVRAICIALDAEVATTETIRAPERLNRKRAEVGKLPISDYHVVKLANRSRAAPLDPDHEKSDRNRPRMHFVRGHWRHFIDHRTWIKWHLRGDPDLGFIDKEYRL